MRLILVRCGVDRAGHLVERPCVMIKIKRRVLTGMLSGVVGLSAFAQEPAAKPAEVVPNVTPPVALPTAAVEDAFKAPADLAAAPADAVKSDSGLASKVLKAGTGTQKPRAIDATTVNYTGWTVSDGKMFDSSAKRREPTTFVLEGVIKGWTEGLQLMVEGEKRRFWIPAKLAYEGNPRGPQGDLVFDVELVRDTS